MKKIFIYITLILLSFSSQATNELVTPTNSIQDLPEVQALPTELSVLNVNQFMGLTPEKYTEMTGKKLGVINTLKLKAAQKIVKEKFVKTEPLEKSIYILLAIFGLAWIAMGLADDWKGNTWIVNLILTFLCWLPGLIHAFVKMKDYYK